MTEDNIIEIERKTQNRIIKLFKEKLDYTYLGNWEERQDNSNLEEELLVKFLKKQKYNDALIKKTLFELNKIINDRNRSIYDANKEFYTFLRYGVQVKEDISKHNETVWLIDWKNFDNNDFYIAEEVTITGPNDKRPDIVLYVNGIALGVLELKRSTISVSEGIRQNLDNQQEMFIKHFFSTIQLVMAGNDTEGLKYGVIETSEKFYLTWKEDTNIKNILDKHLSLLCNKERFLEIIHDFIVFDSGVKKICRHNQYFGVKESQDFIRRREGGIIWHTQGSGKSLTMIWLAKWIKENIDDSRVLIITDREELDEQIERFFIGVDEKIYRTKNGRDLINVLNNKERTLICSLVHKFGRKEEYTMEDFIEEINVNLPDNFKAKGDIYVFVDECHRTQSGKLHESMKKILPDSIFIGFTGTPILKKDKKISKKIFGKYIHTYKYDEAVTDKVILDLQYEARDIDQRLTSQDKVDKWFDAKTKGLTKYAKTELKKRWGTMQKVFSSQSRLSKIVADILLDMELRDRLMSGRGNALLVAGSIYEACKYYELFQKHGLKKCAIITSYQGDESSIKGETTDLDDETENQFKYDTYKKMFEYYEKIYPEIKTLSFEKVIKDKFVKEPGQMKLLIVVDKLLTGFDAPPATYLYIDKSMQDHGLFQAVCRVNRKDSEDKEYGYIIDYKDLFKNYIKARTDYSVEGFGGFDEEDVDGLLKNRIKVAKENLDSSLESVKELCEPVKSKDMSSFIEYFCGNNENPNDLINTEQKRILLYKITSKLVRAFSNIADEFSEAGFSDKEVDKIKNDVKYYQDIRQMIKLASGDYIDLKAYEPAMRHLIDSYIDSDESKTISSFDSQTILDLVVKNGEDAIKKLPQSLRNNKVASSEVIENNARKLIIEQKPINPKYYDNMSILLDEIIKERRENAISYAKYLKKIVEFVNKLKGTSILVKYPKELNSSAKKSLYDNINNNKELVLELDESIIENKQDGWRGNKIKEKQIKNAIRIVLEKYDIKDENELEKIFNIIKNQNEY